MQDSVYHAVIHRIFFAILASKHLILKLKFTDSVFRSIGTSQIDPFGILYEANTNIYELEYDFSLPLLHSQPHPYYDV